MREIKFRAWDKKKCNMLANVSTGTIQIWCYDSQKTALLSNCVLMQYTGLKDKNGVEIYEGDVCEEVSQSGRRSHKSAIRYLDGSFQLCHDHFDLRGNKTGEYEQPLGFISPSDTVEVIGNIYENPKLLED